MLSNLDCVWYLGSVGVLGMGSLPRRCAGLENFGTICAHHGGSGGGCRGLVGSGRKRHLNEDESHAPSTCVGGGG